MLQTLKIFIFKSICDIDHVNSLVEMLRCLMCPLNHKLFWIIFKLCWRTLSQPGNYFSGIKNTFLNDKIHKYYNNNIKSKIHILGSFMNCPEKLSHCPCMGQ